MAFIQRLKELGIHADIARKIWYEYLIPFDRWMVYAAHKCYTDVEVFAIFDNLKGHKYQLLSRLVAMHGYLDIIKGIVVLNADSWPNYRYHNICNEAARCNQPNIIKWAFSNGYTGSIHIISYAVLGGNLEVLQWLHNNIKSSFQRNTYISAIHGVAHISRKIEILQWLYDHNYPQTEDGDEVSRAVRIGSREIIQWLWNHNFQSNNDLCADAASIGDIELIKWLQQRNYVCNESTCESASFHGHLETLKWLRQNGCPWDEEVTMNACDNCDLEMFKWAIQNGCPYNRDDIILNYTNDHPVRKYVKEEL